MDDEHPQRPPGDEDVPAVLSIMAVDSADDVLGSFPASDDIDTRLESDLKENPLPKHRGKRSYEAPLLVTEEEEAATDKYKRKVGDLTKRESTIFVHGYRVRGEYERKHMETLLRSMNQTVQIMASLGRASNENRGRIPLVNNPHTDHSQMEVHKGKRSSRTSTDTLDYQKRAVNAVLELDQSNYDKIRDIYGLSVEQTYDAIQDLIKSIEDGNHWFLETPGQWPHILYDRIMQKCLDLNVKTTV
jgi:hypothetical protein